MNNTVTQLKCAVAAVMLLMSHAVSAQIYNRTVEQYCTKVGTHPYECYSDNEFSGFFYGGLAMSNISGYAAGKNTLWGLDLGFKFSNMWGQSCFPFKLLLNEYLEGKISTLVTNDYYGSNKNNSTRGGCAGGEGVQFDNDCEIYPTVYAGQLTVAPGIRYKNVSIDCGPFIGYSALALVETEDNDSFFDFQTSGIDFGVRVGLTIHIHNTEIGLRYDKGLTDQNKQLKKNDLSLTIGARL